MRSYTTLYSICALALGATIVVASVPSTGTSIVDVDLTTQTDGSVGACHASILSATVSWQEVAQVDIGRLIVRNMSMHACLLKGQPTIRVISPSGHPLAVVETAGLGVNPNVGQGLSVQIRRIGMLLPGRTAYAELRWGNWCGGPVAAPVGLVVALPGANQADQIVIPVGGFAHASDGSYHYEVELPGCLTPASPSRLAVGAFQLVGPAVRDPSLLQDKIHWYFTVS